MIIKNLRLAKSWSQEELSIKTNLSTRTIQRIEKHDKASNGSIKALAKVFDMSIDDLNALLLIKSDNTYKYSFFDYKTIRFIAINIMLMIINLLTSPDNIWFLYVFFSWGLFFAMKKYKKYLEFKNL